jgi:hypothetical protein
MSESIADHFAAQLEANGIELKRPTDWQKQDEQARRRKRHADAESLSHETTDAKPANLHPQGLF